MTQKLATAALVLAAAAGSASAEKLKFEYWYGLTGDLGAVVAETCNRFNASQDQFEAVCVGQDGYEKAVQNTIAAFRAGKHPTILQSFDAGTADLMLSGEFYPVTKLMADTGVTVDWSDYFPGIANYYSSKSGEFFSMPWNSSTPVYYFNKDHFAKAGITEAPVTWEGMEAAFKALKSSGQACGLAYAPSSWIDLEQFSMAHNIPVASNNNGYDGLDTELVFNTTLHVQHMDNIQRWINEGYALLRTQAAGKTSRDSFVEGECSVFFSSIADHNTIHKLTPAFGWDVQIIPTYEGVERHNTVVGGASLWVLAGKTEDEYKAAAAYLAFLATKPEQQFLLENSGYIPVTKSTYEALRAEGFYAKEPYINRDIAMKSLTWTEPSELTRGICARGCLCSAGTCSRGASRAGKSVGVGVVGAGASVTMLQATDRAKTKARTMTARKMATKTPEHVSLRAPGHGMIAARLELVEDLGAARLWSLKIEDIPFSLITEARPHFAEGAVTGLTLDLRHAHLFDGASGKRIEARMATATVHAVSA